MFGNTRPERLGDRVIRDRHHRVLLRHAPPLYCPRPAHTISDFVEPG